MCWLSFVLSLNNGLNFIHKKEQGQTAFRFYLGLILYFHSPFLVGIWSQRQMQDVASDFTSYPKPAFVMKGAYRYIIHYRISSMQMDTSHEIPADQLPLIKSRATCLKDVV